MKKISALLVTTAIITVTTAIITVPMPAYAGVDQPPGSGNEPFFWTDIEGTSAEQTRQDEASPSPGERPDSADSTDNNAADSGIRIETPDSENRAATPVRDSEKREPANPMIRTYPRQDSPQNQVPENGRGRYFDADCYNHPNAPDAWARNNGMRPDSERQKRNPMMDRRGERIGDDGVLEGIQDDPCSKLWRRGGPNAASVNEYTHPDDIRRANALEDRRIPTHDVGKHSADNPSAWHRNPDNPYIGTPRTWKIRRGTMLSQVLSRWGEEAGYNIIWRSPYDYVIKTDAVLKGTFPEAAGQVIESFRAANPPISADFYFSNNTVVVNSSNEFDGR